MAQVVDLQFNSIFYYSILILIIANLPEDIYSCFPNLFVVTLPTNCYLSTSFSQITPYFPK